MSEEFEIRKKQELDKNFKVFKEMLPELMKTHKGEYVIMKDGNILSYHKEFSDALEIGNRDMEDKLFSIQEVDDTTINLGIYSYV